MVLDDRTARAAAVDPTRSFCVSAPAGSGKTELLTQRVLSLLSRVERPEQVLAITFTKKAAIEMADRISEKLEQARQNTPVKYEHEKLTRKLAIRLIRHAELQGWALDEDPLNLRTIDSFCYELSLEMPISSGIGGRLEPVDDPSALYESAVDSFLGDADGYRSKVVDPLRNLLLHYENDWQKVRALLISLLARRADWGPYIGPEYDFKASQAATLKTVQNLIADRLTAIGERLAPWLHDLKKHINEARVALSKEPIKLCKNAECLSDWQSLTSFFITKDLKWRKPSGVNARMGFKAGSDSKIHFIKILKQLSSDPTLKDDLLEIRELPNLNPNDPAWKMVVNLASILPLLQAYLLLKFQTSGCVDHAQITISAIQALGTDDYPTELAERLDYQIDHILVDEFQDTSAPQVELLRRLTRAWEFVDKSYSSPRTIFIVGDAMQSIYGFRYAEVELFLKARSGIFGNIPVTPIELSSNFRCRPKIVSWVNKVFPVLLGNLNDPKIGRVGYSNSESTRKTDVPQNEGVCIKLFSDASNSTEALELAREAEELLKKHPKASIGILVRAKQHAMPIIEALSGLNLQFSGRSLRSVSDQPIVTDLLSLCGWLANPADNVAGLALLRSRWCGLTLRDIVEIFKEHPQRPFDLLKILEATKDAVPCRDVRSRLSFLYAALIWGVEVRDRLSLPVWIEQIWLRLGGPAACTSTELRDVSIVFDVLRQGEEAGHRFDIEFLKRSIEHYRYDCFDLDQQIQVMTIHKAKGLEFDYVFLPELHRRTRVQQRDLLRWYRQRNNGEDGMLIAADDRDKESNSIYNYLSWLARKKNFEESKRLLYVGVTRAREKVFLSGTVNYDSNNEIFPTNSGSLLSLLAEITDIEFQKFPPDSTGRRSSRNNESYHDLQMSPKNRLKRLKIPYMAKSGTNVPHNRGDSASTANPRPTPTPTPGLIFDTVHRRARIAGIVLHRQLELLSNRTSLPSNIDSAMRQSLAFNLRKHGLSNRDVAQVLIHCENQIEKVLQCPRGQWILQKRLDAHSELKLIRYESNEANTYVVDRTFFDEDTGHRWVIDYKTSEPGTKETVQSFILRERRNHEHQLSVYADLVKSLHPEEDMPVRQAIYLIAIQELVECLA